MFEEVKEMIDSTIYTNGRGEVTAQNINLAMHGVVEATEEELGKVNDAVKTVEDKVTALEENGTGGGSGALRVWLYEVDINELTQEQVNENIATYNSLLKDVAQPVVIGMYYSSSNEGLTTTIGQSMVCNVAVQVHEYDGEKIELVSVSASDFEVLLNPDGTIELVSIDEPSTPASSGPLTFYVGYFTTLSAEERITVEQKEHNAKMFEIYKSSPYALGVFVDSSEVYTASMGMSGRAIKTSLPYQAQYFPVETGAESIMLKQKITDNSEIGVIIFPDGSVYLANELE